MPEIRMLHGGFGSLAVCSAQAKPRTSVPKDINNGVHIDRLDDQEKSF